MSVKISAKELRRFWNDPAVWKPKEGVRMVVEDEEITVLLGGQTAECDDPDNHDQLPDEAVACVTGGFIYDENLTEYQEGRGLETEIRRWLKRQTIRTVSVEVPADRLDDLKAAVRRLGGKVSG